MTKSYFGQNRKQNLESLSAWLENGPPVCFLEGFPGTGKSDLAQALLDSAKRTAKATIFEEIPDRASPPIIADIGDANRFD